MPVTKVGAHERLEQRDITLGRPAHNLAALAGRVRYGINRSQWAPLSSAGCGKSSRKRRLQTSAGTFSGAHYFRLHFPSMAAEQAGFYSPPKHRASQWITRYKRHANCLTLRDFAARYGWVRYAARVSASRWSVLPRLIPQSTQGSQGAG